MVVALFQISSPNLTAHHAHQAHHAKKYNALKQISDFCHNHVDVEMINRYQHQSFSREWWASGRLDCGMRTKFNAAKRSHPTFFQNLQNAKIKNSSARGGRIPPPLNQFKFKRAKVKFPALSHYPTFKAIPPFKRVKEKRFKRKVQHNY